MRYVNDPRQNRLFDVFEEILSPPAYTLLRKNFTKAAMALLLSSNRPSTSAGSQ